MQRLRIAFLLLLCAAPVAGQELPAFDVVTTAPIVPLTFTPVDAEFSGALNAVVAVSTSPNRLNIQRPDAQTLMTVDLAAAPTCVSVSPDGNYAAVGHNQSVTYVDLVNPAVVKTFAVTMNVVDVVLAANGYIYASGFGSLSMISINVATDAVTSPSSAFLIFQGSMMRRHPGGAAIYLADTSVSPSDIRKVDISTGTGAYAYDSPYHGDYPMCGDLWISEDGTRIFTRCGNTFSSSTTQSLDMIYTGRLGSDTSIRWLSHSTAGSNIALVPGDTEVHYYTEDYLVYRGKVVLPVFAGSSAPANGRWVFFNAAGTKQYVVVQADSGYGQVPDHGIVTLDCTSATVTPNPAATTIGASAATVQFGIVGTPGCGWKATTSTPWINTLSTGVSDGTVSFTVTANTSITARTGTIDVGGATFTVTQSGVTPMSVTATATSTTSISLSWSFGSADHFEVWRGASLIATPATSAYVDTVAPGGAYIYKVRAVLTGGAMSDFSKPDYAHTFALTDPVLTPGTPIRAAHVTELRTVANAIRSAAGLSAATFTDPSLAGVFTKAIHITELRDAIGAVRSSLGLPAWPYTALSAGTAVQTTPTLELRTSLQ